MIFVTAGNTFFRCGGTGGMRLYIENNLASTADVETLR
jgi:hypothetical protein